MKIVFWSDRPGHGFVTSNMLALSGIAATQFNYKCSIMQLGHAWHNGMHQAYMDMGLVSGDYFQDTGIDALLRTVKTGATDTQQIVNCGFSFLNRNLDLYVPTKAEIPESYYKELLDQQVALMNAIDGSHDLSFFDAGSGNTPYAITAMEEADIIIICLPSNVNHVADFISNYKIEANNLYFLFGNYDKDTSMNVKNVCKRFKKSMNAKTTGIVPHDINFSDAVANGTLSRFFLSSKKLTPKDTSYTFIKETKKSFVDIMKYMGYKMNVES